jgi:23S rRNA (cytosine1962-C5)-methyltransferase
MDPPPYGRGPDGERWTLEEKLDELIGMSASLLKAENRFFILNMYAVGLSSTVGKNIIKSHFNRTPEVGEFFLKSKTGNDLPMGTFARFTS